MSLCERTERVAEYVLRALSANERAAFEQHAAECAACRDEIAAMRPITDALADWPANVLRPPVPLWERVAQRVGIDAGPEPQWTDEPAWKGVAPGIRCKLLATDTVKHRVSMLVTLAPNTAYPAHTHAGVEELHLLDGELWIEDRKLSPGDYNRAEGGTSDQRVFSETGCTCVLITSYRDEIR